MQGRDLFGRLCPHLNGACATEYHQRQVGLQVTVMPNCSGGHEGIIEEDW